MQLPINSRTERFRPPYIGIPPYSKRVIKGPLLCGSCLFNDIYPDYYYCAEITPHYTQVVRPPKKPTTVGFKSDLLISIELVRLHPKSIVENRRVFQEFLVVRVHLSLSDFSSSGGGKFFCFFSKTVFGRGLKLPNLLFGTSEKKLGAPLDYGSTRDYTTNR